MIPVILVVAFFAVIALIDREQDRFSVSTRDRLMLTAAALLMIGLFFTCADNKSGRSSCRYGSGPTCVEW